MAKKLYEENSVKAIADAIRTKNGETTTYKIGEMAAAINGIGGGGDLSNAIVTYNQVNSTATAYLTAAETYTASDYSATIMTNYEDNSNTTNEKPLGYSLAIAQSGKLYLIDEETGKGREESVSVGTYVVYNLIPGHIYRYLLKSSSDITYETGRFKAIGDLRMIYMENCHNFRDMGGWSCDGGKTNYGLLLRGAQLETEQAVLATTVDKKTIRDFGILYEFDLRDNEAVDRDTTDTSDDINSCCAADYITYERISLAYHATAMNLTRSEYLDTVKVLKTIMSNVVKGIPTYFHCAAGADRTGTIAVILEALLGFAQKDIDKDYELTSFYPYYERLRTNDSYKGQINYINTFSGSTFRDKCVDWALQAGITLDEINAFRAAMINGTPEIITRNLAVTSNLTGCTNNNSATSVSYGSKYEATISPESGKTMSSITVTMGGTNITSSSVSGNKITIAKVTGIIVITATAITATVTYTVTNTLTHCSNSNSATTVAGGGTYTGTLSPDNGYTLGAITVTMDGTDISSTAVSGNTISITNITGNISISCVATEMADVNQLPLATDTSGNLYNGGVGYKENYRLNSSGTEAAQSGMYVTGFIPYTKGLRIKLVNVHLPSTNSMTNWAYSYIGLYDSSKTKLASNYSKDYFNISTNTHTTDSNGYITQLILNMNVGSTSIMDNVAYIRISCPYIGADSEIYVDNKAILYDTSSIDLLTTYGYADDIRLSTSSGSEKTASGYVTIGHTSPIPIDKTTYPNGATIRITGADDVVGNSSPYTDSAWVTFTTGGTTFSQASYIQAGSAACGTFVIDSDRKGFTLTLASLVAPRYIKFCIKGAGANVTATLTPL